jgi:hypothetical protein
MRHVKLLRKSVWRQDREKEMACQAAARRQR